MKQKFPAFSFVHVQKEMPSWMSHFPSDFDAIVLGTYSQLFGGKDVKSYSLAQIYDGVIINSISWYDEYQLSFLEEQDYLKAQEMVEDYRLETPEWETKRKIAGMKRIKKMFKSR
jgi:hypothetical protein